MKGKSRLCLSVCVLVFSGVGQPEETSGIGDLGITAGAVQLKGRFFFPGGGSIDSCFDSFLCPSASNLRVESLKKKKKYSIVLSGQSSEPSLKHHATRLPLKARPSQGSASGQR